MNENIFLRYWHAYGGLKALLTSPYFICANILTVILYPAWSAPLWWEDVLSIMPNILGFSLGGYAMWMAVGDDDFRKLISGAKGEGKISPYMKANAAFVHFILLQMLSILLSLFAKTYAFPLDHDHIILKIFGPLYPSICLLGYFLAYLVFIYALLSAVAAVFALLRISSWYDKAQSSDMENK